MKKLIGLIFLLFFISRCFAQTGYEKIELKTLNQQNTNLKALCGNEEIVVLSFWASWCKPCILEQNAIAENIEDWNDEVAFKYIAVSIDDPRSGSKVKSLVNGSGWEFEVVLDQNQELKRFFGVNNIPFTVILKNNNVIYRHAGYLPGDEQILWDKIKTSNE